MDGVLFVRVVLLIGILSTLVTLFFLRVSSCTYDKAHLISCKTYEILNDLDVDIDLLIYIFGAIAEISLLLYLGAITGSMLFSK